MRSLFVCGRPLSSTPRSDRRSSRNGKYGVDDSYCSHAVATLRMSVHCSSSSCVSRDLPMPGSPTSSTKLPKPARTVPTEAVRRARSRCRSTMGRRVAGDAVLCAAIEPSSNACTGSLLPLTWNGEARRVKSRRGALDDRGAGEDLSVVCLRHQASGERSRVAEDRVGAAERRADEPGKKTWPRPRRCSGAVAARRRARVHRA